MNNENNNARLTIARIQTANVVEVMKVILRKNGISFRFETGELKDGFATGMMQYKLTEEGYRDFLNLPLDVRQNIKVEMMHIAHANGCMFNDNFDSTLPTLTMDWCPLCHVEQRQKWNEIQIKWRMDQKARRAAAC